MKELLNNLAADCFAVIHNETTGRASALCGDGQLVLLKGYFRDLNLNSAGLPWRRRGEAHAWTVYESNAITPEQTTFLEEFLTEYDRYFAGSG